MLSATKTSADSSGNSALHRCTTVEEAEALIKLGFNVDAKNDHGRTPLHKACIRGSSEVATVLVSAGAEVDAEDKEGCTPLHYACKIVPREVTVKTLIGAGADVNAKNLYGERPLHYACANGSLKCVSLLLDAGGDVNARDSEGWTPLHNAARFDLGHIISFLVEHGADVNAKDADGTMAIQLCKTDEVRALLLPEVHRLERFLADLKALIAKYEQ